MDARRATIDLVIRSSTSAVPCARPFNGSSAFHQSTRHLRSKRFLPTSINPSVRSASNRAFSPTPHPAQQATAPKPRDEDEEQTQEQDQEQDQPRPSTRTSPLSSSESSRSPYNPQTATEDVKEHFNFLRPSSSPNIKRTPSTNSNKPASSWHFLLGKIAERKEGQQGADSSLANLPSTWSHTSKSNNRADSSLIIPPPNSVRRRGPGSSVSFLDSPHGSPFAEPDIGPPSFQLGPVLPRGVDVIPERGVDVTRAISAVNVRCYANSIKADTFRQRFHERPGVRRKRLAGERWRRRFRDTIIESIRRVKTIRKQGW